MTLYIQPYPYRRMSRRWAAQPGQPEYRSLGVNVREQDDAYVLSALVPGWKDEDLNIQVLENVVTIEGEYRADEVEYLLNELPHGNFRRALRMPAELQADKVEAKIADGVLTLSLPKDESAKPKKIKKEHLTFLPIFSFPFPIPSHQRVHLLMRLRGLNLLATMLILFQTLR